MELLAVHVPCNRLAGPTTSATVPYDTPVVPALVGDGDGTGDAVGLVAYTAGVHVAVDRAVARQLSVDRFHNVQLAARRPPYPIIDRVTQEPERGPDALLVRDVVVAES